MWDKPTTFVYINLLVYVTLLLLFGFQITPIIALCFSIFVFVYNLKFVNFSSALSLSILYLLIFDSDAFTFTSFKIRIWYFPLIILILQHFLSFKPTIKKASIPFVVPVCALFIFSIYYLFIETFTFKLHIIKYWLFSVGLIYVLILFFKKQVPTTSINVLRYIFSLIVFVSVFGLIQYTFNRLGNYSLINSTRDVRPEAFFSETTWFAEFIVLGFVLISILARVTENKNYYIWSLVFVVCLFISATRNAFLGLAIFIIIELSFFFIKGKIKTRIRPRTFLFINLFLISGILIASFNIKRINNQIEIVINRFDLKKDDSGKGRIEAFEVSYEMMKKTPWHGYGFYWDEDVKAGIANTAVGAKSFNLLFMIYHIFGPLGFILFLILIILYFFQLITAVLKSYNVFNRSAFTVFLIFFVMAMFAPIHQFPLGMLFVAFSVYLFNLGNGKNLLYRSES